MRAPARRARYGGALKFIVNVPAMERRLYRHKSARHPRTDMAKSKSAPLDDNVIGSRHRCLPAPTAAAAAAAAATADDATAAGTRVIYWDCATRKLHR